MRIAFVKLLNYILKINENNIIYIIKKLIGQLWEQGFLVQLLYILYSQLKMYMRKIEYFQKTNRPSMQDKDF